ncbi:MULTISPECIES: hypothetical protein [Pandoraea]|uniref:hypothetical protein n=1 Tax=Pandoraea TaxID=93217 RepID=UPI001F5E0354|nr:MULTISPECIES: hypothetical protein [Pandoraea]MCI3206416.1 hypothetical protein [Pandoraea sp. LA3]MDN4584444.1 hypothetical protein [Pandoraea capi]
MPFTVQKLHPALRAGLRLTIAGSNAPMFSFQGSFDSSCALHAAAMALTVHQCMPNPLRPSSRHSADQQEFLHRIGQFWQSGITLVQLSNLLGKLRLGLKPTHFEGAHPDVIQFCAQQMLEGCPVILYFHEWHRTVQHAALVVGVEGDQRRGALCPHTLLLIDAAECEPCLAAYNARLTWCSEDASASTRALYETAFQRSKIVAVGAIAVKKRRPSTDRRDKPP